MDDRDPRPPSKVIAPVALTGGVAGILDTARWSGRWSSKSAAGPSAGVPVSVEHAVTPALRAQPAPAAQAVVAAPSGAGTVDGALWIAAMPWLAADRARLRGALGKRYDAHARLVTRTLAEEPGLRAAGANADLVTDLVALCAYLAATRDVNAVLRGGGDAHDPHTLVARGAVSALGRLPTVLGPVFAAATDTTRGTYRGGDELIEPAFVDAQLSPAVDDEARVQYVIWSVSARRTDRFTPACTPVATFPPGSRFDVLAVDPPAERGPIRVLLRDRTGERGRPHPDGLVDQLRDWAARGGQTPSRSLSFALGLDDLGQRFAPPAAPVTGRVGR